MAANTDVDDYIATAELWPEVIAAVRPVLLEAGLEEQIKWNKPCYGHEGANICILQEMKGFLAIMFFKGALLPDPDGLLTDQGPNSRSAKRIELRSVGEVDRLADAISTFVAEALEAERRGLEVPPAPEEPLAEELRSRLDADPELAAAFAALTPGRRREYNLHISSAKQSKTRSTRIDKFVPRILAGKGMRD